MNSGAVTSGSRVGAKERQMLALAALTEAGRPMTIGAVHEQIRRRAPLSETRAAVKALLEQGLVEMAFQARGGYGRSCTYQPAMAERKVANG